jgi:hypothetical protein
MRAKITQNIDGTVNYAVPLTQPSRVQKFELSAVDVSTGQVLQYIKRWLKNGKVLIGSGYMLDHKGNCPVYKWDMSLIQMARAFRERETDYLRTLKNDTKATSKSKSQKG